MTPAPLRPITVLVAEDDEALRTLVCEALTRDGYQVTGVEDGNALHLGLILDGVGRGALPDLIVTDQRMPGRSGLDVLETMRRHGWETPVVLMTAFGDTGTHARARALGRCTVIDKPFDLDDLRAAVRSAARWG